MLRLAKLFGNLAELRDGNDDPNAEDEQAD
jgi:hypothetical protein